MENLFNLQVPEKILEIASEIRKAGGRAFLVGGFVRDVLLGNTDSRDFDIEVYDLEQESLLQILKSFGRTDIVGKAFGVFHLSMRGLSLDFSFPRTESKVGYGHRGFLVETNPNLTFKEAAYRRDFTINAMGMELPEMKLCDPYGGEHDLKERLLRHVGPAFSEDSLRILRGVQFASRFELTLTQETIELCRTLSLSDLSVERIFEEFKKWLLKPGKPSFGLKAFLDIGLENYFPEILPLASSFENLALLLDKMFEVRKEAFITEEAKTELAFSALLVGNAFLKNKQADEKAKIKENVLAFLNRITNEIHLIKKVPEILTVYGELDFETIPADAVLRRYAVRLDGLSTLCSLLFSTPEHLVFNPLYAKEFFERSSELNLLEKAPKPYLTGKMLLDLGMTPGKEMGVVIQESFELQLNGEIKNANEALEFAKNKLAISI